LCVLLFAPLAVAGCTSSDRSSNDQSVDTLPAQPDDGAVMDALPTTYIADGGTMDALPTTNTPDFGQHQCTALSGFQIGPPGTTVSGAAYSLYSTISSFELQLVVVGAVPGVFDLGCKLNEPCTTGSLYVDASGEHYGSTSGTLMIASVAAPGSNEITGTITGLELHPLSGSELSSLSSPDDCYTVADISFDTIVPLGTPCTDENECGSTQICSVASMTCTASECDGFGTCPVSTDDCLRGSGQEVGFCVTDCDQFAPCPAGYVCGDLDYCQRPGMVPLDGACGVGIDHDVVSACAPGLICASSNGSLACLATCDPYTDEPGCDASQRCLHSDPIGFCGAPLPAADVSVASIGASCVLPSGLPLNANDSAPCGDDGTAYRGLCFAASGTTDPVCWLVCDPRGTPCPDVGQTCTFVKLNANVSYSVCQ
jgi:hypothetical protein